MSDSFDPIPDRWPPSEESLVSLDVPMFPLGNVFLFPRQLMPLHVFEPRYRQMVEDSLDGPGRIVLATVLENQDENSETPPDVLPVAGLGEIARHERLDDGRYLIWVFGLARVRIQEIESERLYRRVRCEPLTEGTMDDGDEARLRPELTQAILSRTEQFLNLPEDIPIALLTDLLSQRMDLPQLIMEGIFAEANATTRAELALRAHVDFPQPPSPPPKADSDDA